ncbi:MAG TPA: HEXXH motif-containing putative peptide modification protein [Streptosporangiaceae bacterium]|nr:HEXXH motif-containing putative peptide modification protein [Streptosporangiaceae bacterium]
MNLVLGGPITHLRGAPFVDSAFTPRKLLAAVAATRQIEAEQAGMSTVAQRTGRAVQEWLMPSQVLSLRPEQTPMPAAPLHRGRKARIEDVLNRLGAELPEWEPLLTLPVRFALMRPANGAISASSRAWPQHVLLADDAFASQVTLREQLVHELAHQWLYLVQEIWAFQERGGQGLTLPSGTGGRSAAEVIGATHVAAALIVMYATVGGAPPGRVDHLRWYGTGCLDLLAAIDTDLTEAGRQVARRLREAF